MKTKIVHALIKGVKNEWDEPKYLCQYDIMSKKIQFIGGHVERNESYEEAIVREIKEELTLSNFENDDITLLQRLPEIQESGISPTTKRFKEYRFFVFLVQIRNLIIDEKIDFWFTEEELDTKYFGGNSKYLQKIKNVIDFATIEPIQLD